MRARPSPTVQHVHQCISIAHFHHIFHLSTPLEHLLKRRRNAVVPTGTTPLGPARPHQRGGATSTLAPSFAVSHTFYTSLPVDHAVTTFILPCYQYETGLNGLVHVPDTCRHAHYSTHAHLWAGYAHLADEQWARSEEEDVEAYYALHS